MAKLATAPVKWRHKKTGKEYHILDEAIMQSKDWATDFGIDGSKLVDMQPVVVYRSVDNGSLWVRPRDEFLDRFEEIKDAS